MHIIHLCYCILPLDSCTKLYLSKVVIEKSATDIDGNKTLGFIEITGPKLTSVLDQYVKN